MSTGGGFIDREVRGILANLDSVIDRCPDDFRLHMRERWGDRFLLLDGDELACYRGFRAACKLAQETAAAHAAARDQLRTSIEELGRLIAPSPKAG